MRKKKSGEQLPQVANFYKKVTACIGKEIKTILKRFKTTLKIFKKGEMINRTNKI
ncbi:hypothetical protein [Avibacterium sp. 20-129]|uniref:hypothetical protein n=1 Tax=Avibacterium sp. 20-129 TaxID=2911525 RepID=UPI0022453739|nr:hypothetical protein [Avibacterium sp. 20-129]MCW9699724.1 hypothetical protein [Avibacterium sp. 20-129]